MLIDKLKEDMKAEFKARELRGLWRKDLLGVLIGDCTRDKKQPDDSEVLQMIKKFIKNSEINASYFTTDEDPRKFIKISDSEEDLHKFRKWSEFMSEITFLESYLPKQMDEEEIRLIIAACILTETYGLGPIMKHFKECFNGRYDASMVSSCIKEMCKN